VFVKFKGVYKSNLPQNKASAKAGRE